MTTGVKSFFLDLRYNFAMLAAGFLVSAPLRIVQELFLPSGAGGADFALLGKDIILSVLYGGICIGLFVILIPLSNIDWAVIHLPEYKIWEMRVVRNAGVLGAAFLLACLVFGDVSRWLSLRVAWIVFVLMVFRYLSLKAQTLIFKDFYDVPESDPVRIAERRMPRDLRQLTRDVRRAVGGATLPGDLRTGPAPAASPGVTPGASGAKPPVEPPTEEGPETRVLDEPSGEAAPETTEDGPAPSEEEPSGGPAEPPGEPTGATGEAEEARQGLAGSLDDTLEAMDEPGATLDEVNRLADEADERDARDGAILEASTADETDEKDDPEEAEETVGASTDPDDEEAGPPDSGP